MVQNTGERAPVGGVSPRRAWSAPVLEALPSLTKLTLLSAIPGSEAGFSWLNRSDPFRRLG